MSLTVKEKEHWKERIARRIDTAIEMLQAENDPTFLQRIQDEAQQKARNSLGIAELHQQCEQLGAEIAQLEGRRNDAWTEMLATVTGTPLGDVPKQRYESHEVRDAVRRRAAIHKRELLLEQPLGRQILELQHEKEELLDTVWLATSPSQIKELWSRFAKLLNWEPPALQQQAIAIEPMSSAES